MIKIDFSFDSEYGTFSDAIVYSEDSPMTDAEIEAEKQRRFDEWYNNIITPNQGE